ARSTCWVATHTSRAPLTRSMAPPTPGLPPGTYQLARSPVSDTSRAPSTVTSSRPERIMPNEMLESNTDAPGTAVVYPFPAPIRSGSTSSPVAARPMPSSPFSVWTAIEPSVGMWLATSSGMPIPRLTVAPGHRSRAMRAASSSRLRPRPVREASVGSLMGVSQRRVGADDPVHERAGQVDVVGIDGTGRHERLHLDDGVPRRHRGERVEVAGREPEPQVAGLVAQVGVHERNVGPEGFLQDVGAPAEVLLLLGRRLGDDPPRRVHEHRYPAVGVGGADADGDEEGRDARAPGPQPFGQRALRNQLELDLPAREVLGERGAGERAGEPADPALREQQGEPSSVLAAVVG